MMPLSGVRTSWLMFATNSLFARLADSAESFARSSSAAVRLRAETSRPIAWNPVTAPCVEIGCASNSMATRDPSGRTRSISNVPP